MRYFGCSSARWRASSSRMCSAGGSGFAPCGRPVNPLDLSASVDMPVPKEGSLRAMDRDASACLRIERRMLPSCCTCLRPSSLSKLAIHARGTQRAISFLLIRLHRKDSLRADWDGGSSLLRCWRHSRLLHPSVARLTAGTLRPQATGEPAGLLSPMPQPWSLAERSPHS